jgi:hypothetical protein
VKQEGSRPAGLDRDALFNPPIREARLQRICNRHFVATIIGVTQPELSLKPLKLSPATQNTYCTQPATNKNLFTNVDTRPIGPVFSPKKHAGLQHLTGAVTQRCDYAQNREMSC